MSESGVSLIPRKEILSFEEIRDVVTAAVELGVTKVRLTGGEPLVRKDIVTLVQMLAENRSIKDLAMTTNGVLLTEFAKPLKHAGLDRLNISLDALDAARYAANTRGGDVNAVLGGIEAAKDAGFSVIKLNCVVEKSSDEPDAKQVAQFGAIHGFEVQFIRRMNMAKGKFWPVEGGRGGDCPNCNRIRLTSNGFVRPCLFGDIAFSVRELGPREAIMRAVEAKPERGKVSREGAFYTVGG